MALILGIESSCDDTGVAIYGTPTSNGQNNHSAHLLAHVKASQINTHLPFGGVVPELAARDHIKHISPLIQACLAEANIELSQLSAIAYTQGPGLSGALLVGASVATALAMSLDLPVLGVHHMEGHLLAPMLEPNAPDFPFTALLVSGGHTQLVDVSRYGNYKILGQSLDDALGEAFDKTAKLMGLDYPGGPLIEKMAAKWHENPLKASAEPIKFTRPMVNRPGLDFSFSGLKTQVRTFYNASDKSEATKQQIADAFQQTVVDTIVIKCQRALIETGHSQLVISGGVSANQFLRQRIAEKIASNKVKVFYPRLEFCTDNGAMIAYAGYQHYLQRVDNDELAKDYAFNVKPRWNIETLTDSV